MSAAYDIQCGDGGTWIVRLDGQRWKRIAFLLAGAYTEADEAILGNADALADALETCKRELRNYERGELGDKNSTVIDAIDDAEAALRAAGRLP